MNKHNLSHLMVLGILSGSLIVNKTLSAENVRSTSSSNTKKTLKERLADVEDGNMDYHLMTEEELLLQLNDSGAKLYKSLSPEGKELALKVASQRCMGLNECKGLNACKTDKNNCAGQGSCKGTGKCALSDPNVAVKLAAKKMGEKRIQAQGNSR